MDDNNDIPCLLPTPEGGYPLTEIEEILLAYAEKRAVKDKGIVVIRLLPYSFSVN
jgi:hypothetical protein